LNENVLAKLATRYESLKGRLSRDELSAMKILDVIKKLQVSEAVDEIDGVTRDIDLEIQN
jgi:hypothetical protein